MKTQSKIQTTTLTTLAIAFIGGSLVSCDGKKAPVTEENRGYSLSPEERRRLHEPSPDTYKTELQEMNERATRENKVMDDERLRERVRKGY